MERYVDLPTRRATKALARAFARELHGGEVVYLEGELGSGKTFFARALCRALGVSENVPIQSPTFNIVRNYKGKVPILHADFYRLTNDAEVYELGLHEALSQGAILLVEWGLKYRDGLSPKGLVLRFEYSQPTGRAVHISTPY